MMPAAEGPRDLARRSATRPCQSTTSVRNPRCSGPNPHPASKTRSHESQRSTQSWDARQGTERPNLVGHIDRVSGCAVSPDGSWVVSGSGETLKVWDAYTGDVRFTLTGHTSVVNGCAVSLDGKWIVSASYDNTLKIWNMQAEVESLITTGYRDTVNDCAVSPSGDYIVSALADGTLPSSPELCRLLSINPFRIRSSARFYQWLLSAN